MVDMNIAPIGPLAQVQQNKTLQKDPAVEEGSFGQWLSQSLSEVNRMQHESNVASQKLISGESKDIHGTMIAMQKSSIAMEMVIQVRNKVIAAYDEIKRMQF